MRYTVDDIPYLVGLHFVLVNHENDTVFLIDSYKRRQVRVDWPHRRGSQDMAIYGENVFLFHLNSGHWKIIDLPDISSLVNESNDAVKERGIILKFNPRPTPEQEKMIYARLTEMYPSIRWSSSGNKLSTRSYSRMGLDTLFIESKKHVTWGAGPDADEVYLESPHYWDLYDGWNFINGKSTSEIFDTLYEQEDDGFDWVRDLDRFDSYWDILKNGDTIIVKPHHDIKQQEYFQTTLNRCRSSLKPSNVYGKVNSVRYVNTDLERHDLDCGACQVVGLDCDTQVKSFLHHPTGFHLSSEMVDIEIVPKI